LLREKLGAKRLQLTNELIVPAKAANGVGKVTRRERHGGLRRFYYRETG
jgi:hypothetical protein